MMYGLRFDLIYDDLLRFFGLDSGLGFGFWFGLCFGSRQRDCIGTSVAEC